MGRQSGRLLGRGFPFTPRTPKHLSAKFVGCHSDCRLCHEAAANAFVMEGPPRWVAGEESGGAVECALFNHREREVWQGSQVPQPCPSPARGVESGQGLAAGSLSLRPPKSAKKITRKGKMSA